METTALSSIYPRQKAWGETSSWSTPQPAASPTLLASDLASQVRRYSLGPLPMLGKIKTPVSWLDPLCNHDWLRGLVSFATINVSQQQLDSISERDLERTRLLINRIAGASSSVWPLEYKAFLIHSLMSYVVAYRSSAYFHGPNNASRIFTLPTRIDGRYVLKSCRFEEEVNICGGASVRIFAPVDGRGSPTYLFHGTKIWTSTPGAGLTLVDDFNPLGPGDDIRKVARKRLRPLIEAHCQRYGEAPIAIGHSQGAIVSTALAVDLPGLFSQVVAFSPTRPTQSLERKWKRQILLSKELKHFQTLFGREVTERVNNALGAKRGERSRAIDRLLAAAIRGELVKSQEQDHFLKEVRRLIDLKKEVGYGPVSVEETKIHSIVSRYDGWIDPVSLLGDAWIGRVFEVNRRHRLPLNLRHQISVASHLDFDIRELDIDEENHSIWQRFYIWQISQRIAAAMVYCILMPLLICKRLLVGWESATLMRYGILGLPVQLGRHILDK